jgi:peptide/nickel transport system permease protein
MWRYTARRLLLMIPTFFGITLVTFAVMQLAPGDPLALGADALEAGAGGKEAREAQRAARGLDRPLVVQYARWVGKVATLDFGRSFQDGRPVLEKLREALPRTLLLATVSLLLAYLVSIPVGAWAAANHGSRLERAVTLLLFVLYSLPGFWVAIMLLLYLAGSRGVDLFPMQGLTSPGFEALGPVQKVLDVAWHLVLPVTVLTYAAFAVLSRYMKAGMMEVVRQDYVRTARAKGLPERTVVFRHALRNSLLPVITLLGLMLPHLVGGSVIVERIFGIHGMGLLAFEAILHRDYPMVMGVTTLVALLTMGSMLLSDLLYAAADPRVDLEGGG